MATRQRVLFGIAAAALAVALIVVIRPGLAPEGVLDRVDPERVAGTIGALGVQDVDFETLDRGPMGPWLAQGTWLIDSREVWAKRMSEMASQGQLDVMVEAPEVDWDRSMVVLVTLGQRTSAGYGIEVVSLKQDADQLVAEVKITQPESSLQQQTMTAPYHLLRLDRRAVTSLTIREQGAASDDVEEEAGEQQTSWGSVKRRYSGN